MKKTLRPLFQKHIFDPSKHARGPDLGSRSGPLQLILPKGKTIPQTYSLLNRLVIELDLKISPLSAHICIAPHLGVLCYSFGRAA